jgi:outer membrane protein OmpA-like peptidoglycan-associated protein
LRTSLADSTRDSTGAALAAGPSGKLHRKCACGQHTPGGGKCEDCKRTDGMKLQRRAVGTGGHSVAPPTVHDVLRSPGQPLDAATRAFFEPRLGQDFSGVRVHNDVQASLSTREVKALAYTFRHDIAFRAGHYSPASESGKHLIAHELGHVLNQTAGRAATQPAQIGLQPEDKPLIPMPVFDKFDPCLIAPNGLPGPLSHLGGQKVCGETAKKVWDFLHPKGGGKPKVDCSLFIGFEPAASGELKGQCCKGSLRSKENCCPPERIALLDYRCCRDDETIQNNHCVKSSNLEPSPPQTECLPGEIRNLFGECCSPGQRADRYGNPCPSSTADVPQPSYVPPLDTTGLRRPKPIFKFGTIESTTIDHFDVDGATVPAGNADQLDHVAGLLQVYRDVQIHVEGHTDSTFTHEHNKGLSNRRADAVKKELLARGIPGDRIVLKGFAEEHLLFPKERDAEEKSRNRRVEIWFQIPPIRAAGANP